MEEDKIFNRYFDLLSTRLNNSPLLNIREDTIRYDFFVAISDIQNLNPWELKLESNINEQTFINRNDKNSKRKEAPLIDLTINTKKIKSSFEFALFRQNSNDNGNINVTERTFKMLNDILRLGLNKHFNNNDAYFVCIADYKMLNHQLKNKILNPFPSDEYLINKELFNLIGKEYKTSKKAIDKRFLDKFFTLNIVIRAQKIYDKKIIANKVKNETRIIVWKISTKKN